MSCPAPMTIRSVRCIAITKLAPIWPMPPARWNLYMPSEGKQMEPKTLDYETDRELPEVRLEEPGQSRPGPRLNRKLAIFGVVLIIIAAGAFLWVRSWDRVSTDDAQVDGHIAPVSSRIYSNVVEVLVNDNQQVKQGQVLVRLDPRDYQANASVAVAVSQAQGANVGVPLTRETTQSGTSSAEAELGADQADYEQAKADYDKASNADVAW